MTNNDKKKPTDLDLHCLQRQGISGFSRTRLNLKSKNGKATNSIFPNKGNPILKCLRGPVIQRARPDFGPQGPGFESSEFLESEFFTGDTSNEIHSPGLVR